MEYNVKVVSPEELMEPLLELLEETEAVPLVISGGSMSPFLVHRRDTVYLSKVQQPLRRGDMILYRRDSGAYILHRIYRVDGDTYTLIGDAHTQPEPGVRPDQVLAIVTAVRRKGKLLGPGSFWWTFFEKIWIRMVPLRPMAMALYSHLTNAKNLERDT